MPDDIETRLALLEARMDALAAAQNLVNVQAEILTEVADREGAHRVTCEYRRWAGKRKQTNPRPECTCSLAPYYREAYRRECSGSCARSYAELCQHGSAKPCTGFVEASNGAR